MAGQLIEAYEARIAAGKLTADAAQRSVVADLDQLARKLRAYVPGRRFDLLGLVIGLTGQPPKGLYIHGGVGRGKTMLMDLFFETVRFERKRRVHFHAFMQDVHRRIAVERSSGLQGDPILPVAQALARDASLLCFDEFHVTDIADAMILSRLFQGLLAEGVVVVATSNQPPDGLYRDGLNRALFLPFIADLKKHLLVRELASPTDYRQNRLIGQTRYLSPLGPAATATLADMFRDLTGVAVTAASPLRLEVAGRMVSLPAAAKDVAFAGFSDLCELPLGTADYLAIAAACHTLVLDGVPRLGPERRNEARRLINLIDVLYDARTCLILAADAEPDDLYVAGDGHDLFERTASRLVEMRSDDYLRTVRNRPAA